MTKLNLVERQVGQQWLITSPDVPGLYVADPSLEKAREAVPAAIELLADMNRRQKERADFKSLAHAC